VGTFFSCHYLTHNSHISATYTNLENHPRLIRVRDQKPVPKIALDRKTGLPSLVDIVQDPQKIKNTVIINTSDESEDSDNDGMLPSP
jgi:protein LTV1